jgi:SAM-dependent methyltransferase
MNQHWNSSEKHLEINEMPFYWRLSESVNKQAGIDQRLRITITPNHEHDYLRYMPTKKEWKTIDLAYKQNENIGFLNPESGQLHTYGASVNNFILKSIQEHQPKKIYEIGCGAGFSISFLKEQGWEAIGIDPSEYSYKWSKRSGFHLLNSYFEEGLLEKEADFIYCNDVFEHVPELESFCQNVYNSLCSGGVFCIATTNSSDSIALGDISMLEHQHVNMFSERSIYSILQKSGFTDIVVDKGSYGNTFHVTAKKKAYAEMLELPGRICPGFFEKASDRLLSFGKFYNKFPNCSYYVPLRCIPYLSSVGSYGEAELYDSNNSWRHKYIDGYSRALSSVQDLKYNKGDSFFIGSLTFHKAIKKTLESAKFPSSHIFNLMDLN